MLNEAETIAELPNEGEEEPLKVLKVFNHPHKEVKYPLFHVF